MKILNRTIAVLIATISLQACNTTPSAPAKADEQNEDSLVVKPVYVTEAVDYDTDDPAIWIHPTDASKSFFVGTDKDENGGLYAFDLKGKIISDKVFKPLQRPNNVDIIQNVPFGDTVIDLALVAERFTHNIRVLRLPDMVAVDGGGIPAFVGEEGEEQRDLMGISSYQNPKTKESYVIAGRKTGPQDSTYLWQYKINVIADTLVTADLVRKFGYFSGVKEIEAIAVDDANGFVYYCDEHTGVRKYYADPAKGNKELTLFGENLFADDNEGIAIYETSVTEGYIFVSDQGIQKLQVWDRSKTDVNGKPLYLGFVKYEALETDGIEITNVHLNQDFPKGMLVAMSDDKTFHMYSMEDVLMMLKKVN